MLSILGEAGRQTADSAPKAAVKRSQPIAVLLTAITGILVIMLVSTFAILARGAFDRQQKAARTLAAVQIERSILSAKADLRSEASAITGGSDNLVDAERIDRINSAHLKSEKDFRSVTDQLKTYTINETVPGLREL